LNSKRRSGAAARVTAVNGVLSDTPSETVGELIKFRANERLHHTYGQILDSFEHGPQSTWDVKMDDFSNRVSL
jgi:hypothetical protein